MDMLSSAADYARRGWKIFPLAPLSKVPLAGTQGFKDATTDLPTIEAWWHASPKANIGLATGTMSGVWVIDIDQKKGRDGAASITAYANAFGKATTPTVIAATPNRGEHWYVKHDEAEPVASRAGVLPGVDIRGNGGYVVLPPSVLAEGQYTWETSWESELGVPPPWVTALAKHLPVEAGRAPRTGSSGKRDPTRNLPWNLVLQGKRASLGRLDELEVGKKYHCFCPFHDDRSISAFCRRISTSFAMVYCSACDTSWWSEKPEDAIAKRIREIQSRLTEIKGHSDAERL